MDIRSYIMNIISELERMSPIFIFLFLLWETWNNKKERIVPILYLIITDPLNYIFKNFIFKPFMKHKHFPFIGQGTRPSGAKNTGIFSNNKLSTSYGMPSGHSQGIGFFLFYELLFKKYDTIGNIIFIILSIYLLYSRVRLNCHTPQQVLIGFLIGSLCAYCMFLLIKKSKKKSVSWAPPSSLCDIKLI